MGWIPLLNNDQYTFTTDDLPALIHGEQGSGAALFSLSLFAQLYHQGEPLLLITSSDFAKEELIKQIQGSATIATVTNAEELAEASDKQVIHLPDHASGLLPTLMDDLEDWQERIALIIKFEAFKQETLSLFANHPHTIYTGDLNTSVSKEYIFTLKYNAKIFFSPLHNDLRLTLPHLGKYHGYYQGRTNQGNVTLSQTT